MIELLVSVSSKPIDLGGGITQHGSIKTMCMVDKVKMTYTGHYQARLVDKKNDAPFNAKEEWGDWASFLKIENKHVKLPIIRTERQEVDV